MIMFQERVKMIRYKNVSVNLFFYGKRLGKRCHLMEISVYFSNVFNPNPLLYKKRRLLSMNLRNGHREDRFDKLNISDQNCHFHWVNSYCFEKIKLVLVFCCLIKSSLLTKSCNFNRSFKFSFTLVFFCFVFPFSIFSSFSPHIHWIYIDYLLQFTTLNMLICSFE